MRALIIGAALALIALPALAQGQHVGPGAWANKLQCVFEATGG